MSKHTGNFMTLSDAIEQFGVNVTRLTLANNDGYDDGDFDIKFANNAILKLNTIKEFVDAYYLTDIINETESYNMWDKIFDSEICDFVKIAETGFIEAKYKNVIVAFNGLITSRNEYEKYCKYCNILQKQILTKKYISALSTVLYSICPSFVKYITKSNYELINWNFKKEFNDSNKYKLLKESLSNSLNECYRGIEKCIKRNITNIVIEIKVFKKYGEQEIDIIENINNMEKYEDLDKKKLGQYKKFAHFIKNNIEKYGDDYLLIITNSIDELDIFTEYIPKIIRDYKINIIEEVIDDKIRFNYGPMFPLVTIGKSK
jgi:isoleucyl-tRNA synthetase